MSEDCQKKAAELGFDLTKQFLTLAFAGIAFVVGLSFNKPGAVSSLMLWLTVGIFAASAVLGLVFLMHGVNLLSVTKTYDIYASSLRILAALQIVLVLVGVVMLVPVLNGRPSKATPNNGELRIDVSADQSLTYPLEPDKDVTVEIDGTKVTVTAKSP